MTTEVDIVNNALQIIGTRTTVTEDEYNNQTSNEAIQARLVIARLRDDLLRMAPWDCGLKTKNLVYITSAPGTPQNVSPATALWQPGQPQPPWTYEYQYPVDCLRACWIVPANQTTSVGSTPIYPVTTGGGVVGYGGPPIKFKVATDTFVPVIAAAVSAGGTNYAIGDVLTFAHETDDDGAPLGAPPTLRVLTVSGGAILTAEVITQLAGQDDPAWGGSYFARQHTGTPIAVDGVYRFGNLITTPTGATFTFTFDQPSDQRVILTNQEYATLVYVRQITNPNVMDPLFQDAWAAVLGSRMAIALSGNKDVANLAIGRANELIAEARKADGNEGLTVNDVTPDWIRIRGIAGGYEFFGPYGFDWGGTFPTFT